MKKLIAGLLIFLVSVAVKDYQSRNKPIVVAQVEEVKAELFINDEVTDILAAQFLSDAKQIKDNLKPGTTIIVHINSPGGSVLAGYSIIETIKSLQKSGFKVNTQCEVYCASMAAVILEFGDLRTALSTSIILFHHAYNAGNPSGRSEQLRVIQHAGMEEMVKRMHITEAQLLYLYRTRGDIWVSASDCMRLNWIDQIVIKQI